MAAILMTCPNTGTTVATGQHISTADHEVVLDRGGRFRCSSCGRVHEWAKGDVTLTEWPGAPSSQKADGEVPEVG